MFAKTPKFIQKLFPSVIWNKVNSQNNIWLTFDDGPSPEVTPFILSILNEEQVKATFFLVGKQIKKYPYLVEQIIENGHIIANHSYSHKSGWQSNSNFYINDVEKCQQLMPENKLFRPPYGKISPRQISHLKKKYKIILWDVLGGDFYMKKKPLEIKKNILKYTKSGSIIVLHNNTKSFKNLNPILKETIQKLKQRGFSFSTTW